MVGYVLQVRPAVSSAVCISGLRVLCRLYILGSSVSLVCMFVVVSVFVICICVC